MKNKYSYLSKNLALFAIGNFVPKVFSFLLVPVYTSCLSAAEYGLSDLISTTISLLLPIFTLDIQDAVMRFAFDERYKKEDVFTSALKIIFAGTGMIGVATIGVAWSGLSDLRMGYLLYFVTMYFLSALSNSVTLFCRGIEQVNVLVISGILHSIVTLSGNVVFLVVFEWGLPGFFLAAVLGQATSVLYCFLSAKLFCYIRWRTPKHVLKDMVRFSFPLIFNVIAWWVNSASDRYILNWISGIAVTGIYAVAYKIPTILTMFQNVFSQAWSISAIKEFDKNDSDGFVGNIYTFMNFAMGLACSAIMIMDIPIARVLFVNEYFEAWKYVPPLLLSVLFNAMSLFVGSIFIAVKDTKALSISTLTGAGINAICNFLFIPLWNAWGAALATMMSYAVTFIMRQLMLKKYIRIRNRWERDIAMYSILILQMLIAGFGVSMIWIQVILLLAVVSLYKQEMLALMNLTKEKIEKLK